MGGRRVLPRTARRAFMVLVRLENGVNVPQVIRRSWELFEPILAAQGYELVEVELGRQHGDLLLRLFIDRAEVGITHDDCQIVSQLLSPVLEVEDLIADNYVLEISSPGVDRPVRKTADFERFAGEEIRVTTQTALSGQKRFQGTLKGFRDGLVVMDCDGRELEVHIENLKKANLVR